MPENACRKNQHDVCIKHDSEFDGKHVDDDGNEVCDWFSWMFTCKCHP